MAGGKGEDPHAGGVGGGNAGRGVFEDQALMGGDPHYSGGLQENVGGGLAVLDVGAGHGGHECFFQPQGLEAGVHVFAGGRGANGTGNAQMAGLREEFQHAGDGFDAIGADPLAVDFLFFEADAGGLLLGYGPAEEVADDGHGAQPALADVVRIGAVEAVTTGHFLPGFHVQVVGVDHDAVHVEDERGQGGGLGHGATPGSRA